MKRRKIELHGIFFVRREPYNQDEVDEYNKLGIRRYSSNYYAQIVDIQIRGGLKNLFRVSVIRKNKTPITAFWSIDDCTYINKRDIPERLIPKTEG